MFYKKNIDTEIKTSLESVYIRKGKFNYTNLEIRANEQISEKNFQKLLKFFNEINTSGKSDFGDVSSDDIEAQIINYLLQFNFLIKDEDGNTEFEKYVYIVSKEKNRNTIQNILGKETNVKNITEFEKNDFVNEIPIFALDSFNYQEWIQINKRLQSLNKRSIFLLVDGDFFHLFMVNNDYSGCLECFFLRMGSRIKEYSVFKNIVNKETTFENNISEHILRFGLSLSKLILESQKTNNSFFIESKILSIYIPTIEIHFDKLLKMSSCSSCGYYSKLQSNEMNINTIESVRRLLNDEK